MLYLFAILFVANAGLNMIGLRPALTRITGTTTRATTIWTTCKGCVTRATRARLQRTWVNVWRMAVMLMATLLIQPTNGIANNHQQLKLVDRPLPYTRDAAEKGFR
jgi:hypothetical protein